MIDDRPSANDRFKAAYPRILGASLGRSVLLHVMAFATLPPVAVSAWHVDSGDDILWMWSAGDVPLPRPDEDGISCGLEIPPLPVVPADPDTLDAIPVPSTPCTSPADGRHLDTGDAHDPDAAPGLCMSNPGGALPGGAP